MLCLSLLISANKLIKKKRAIKRSTIKAGVDLWIINNKGYVDQNESGLHFKACSKSFFDILEQYLNVFYLDNWMRWVFLYNGVTTPGESNSAVKHTTKSKKCYNFVM